MGKIHLFHIIARIFCEISLLSNSRDVWQMYLDKNEFELAKEYCRVRFDCKLSSLIDSFHLVDVPVFVNQRILFKKSYQSFLSICTHIQKITWQCWFLKKICVTIILCLFPRKSMHKVNFFIWWCKNFLSFKTSHVLGQCGSAGQSADKTSRVPVWKRRVSTAFTWILIRHFIQYLPYCCFINFNRHQFSWIYWKSQFQRSINLWLLMLSIQYVIRHLHFGKHE